MRSLKFRVWDIKAGEYEDLLDVIGISPDGEWIYFKEPDEPDAFYTDTIRKNYIIEQYTGLKDKNGKEIYGNDIVKMPSSECVIVDYDAGSFTLNCTHCTATWTMDRWCSELGIHLLDNICTSIEVIGNIHENPELLGGEK